MPEFFRKLLLNLPEVAAPVQKRLSFKDKLKWTGIILVLFYVLSMTPLFGLGPNALKQFEILSIILGASFGSIMSLGIGPIVTASIVLQLLNGSNILKFDLTTQSDRQMFQGLQKFLAIFFIIFEAFIYVFMGGLAPPVQFQGSPAYFQLQLVLIFQLFLGGLLVLFMDEVVSKWGFGSGISLFIVAGVSQSVFIRALSPLPSPNNPNIASGALPAIFQSISAGDPVSALILSSSVISTVIVFVLAVYSQAMKIEIPLSFGKVRHHGIKWPLHFIYTSNIPVILVAALFANIQLWARLLQNKGYPLLGTFSGNVPVSGFVSWINPQNVIERIITGTLTWGVITQTMLYLALLTAGCIIFSWFWVQTSGMDSRSQAKQILGTGLQLPGFRRDERILARLLQNYIPYLTILGAIVIGLLAGLADVSGSLTNGTGLFLSVMIVYRLYEELINQHMMDMNPMLRKFIKG